MSEQKLSTAQHIEELEKENLALRTDVAYWKKQHDRAREREEALKKELADKKARIKYLERRLFGKQSEKGKSDERGDEGGRQELRRRGGQPGSRGPGRRVHGELEVREESFDVSEEQKYCARCGRPRKRLQKPDESTRYEIEVNAYKRTIRRWKYVPGCACEETASILTAEGPPNLIPQSRYGLSVWAHILLHKYRFQIPVARILKAMSLQGLAVPAGTVGDGLKRLVPLFEPIYAALEDKSRQAQWWQADETRWSVFQTTKGKSTYRWYLWIFISEHSVVHIIDPTRSARVIEEHLGTVVEGILLVDRYSAYKSFGNKHKGIMLAFCWSHARRDFIEAGKAYEPIHEWALQWEQWINEVFHRNRLRLQYQPGSEEFSDEDAVIRELLGRMHRKARKELKEKPLHHRKRHVLKSLLEHWEGLTVFVDHPEIPMDNNGAERGLRNPVVGRKNYYGSGAIWSARFTAVMFSIFETLELYKINQQQWLVEYLQACAQTGGLHPPTDIEAHLPWNIAGARQAGVTYCGRIFSAEEIRSIKRLVEEDTSGSRTRISRETCRLLRWYKADGTLKERSMRMALLKMEADGHFILPQRRIERTVVLKPIEHTARTDPREETFMPAGRMDGLQLQIAHGRERQSLWNEYIDRYHYRGYTTPAGSYLKYFAQASDDVVALLGFSSAAWRIAPRDSYIGWTDRQRQDHLSLVLNNNRFLILPWIYSKNLASKLLAMAADQLPDDWERKYGYRPLLLETFVESDLFTGTCYKAANWIHVGTTAGRGRNDTNNLATLAKKEIFLYPLARNFRDVLTIDSS